MWLITNSIDNCLDPEIEKLDDYNKQLKMRQASQSQPDRDQAKMQKE
jgi:hypothetical protein